MADRNGLGFLGCLFGGLTLAVAVTAFVVVLGHVDGSFTLDAASVVAMQQSVG